MNGSRLPIAIRLGLAALLAFAIPALQAGIGEIPGNLVVGAAALVWLALRARADLIPAGRKARITAGLVAVGALALLVYNLGSAPVSAISGKARTPLEVFSVIVLGPLAEECLFRGVLWRLLDGAGEDGVRRNAATLMMTSLLFAVQHLGYWAAKGLPLPQAAYLHAASMFPAGLVFGLLRAVSGSALLPAAVHALVNGAILLGQ